MKKPLTNEQIWGIPDEELPAETKKDYFENQETIDDTEAQTAGPGEEVSG
jgi:hypothetical protein